MDKQFIKLSTKQAGFTLIELVIVIVIIGILAAVAIPKLTDVSTAAKQAKNMAILGAVKSAWSAAFAIKKSEPTAAEVAAQMSDPACNAATTGGDPTGGTYTYLCGTAGINMATTGTLASPSAITCGNCGS